MARLAREISENGLYHIVFRGVNRQHIFEEASDYEKLRDILIELKKEMKYEIYVYCFMSNHVHILLKENNMGDISLIMKRLLTKYARWYNIKYKRSGALIANRYKSKPIEVDEYFLSVVRYIHQNPIKAQNVNSIEDYEWSSYKEYITDEEGLADKGLVWDMLTKEEFVEFHKEEDEMVFTVDDRMKISDDEIRRKILKEINIEPKLIGEIEKNKRNEILRELKNKYSIRQLERVTGISRGVIHKC
ncbi:MAG: transposase [Oscillospiraceae bacterium]|nr:transposase [Oscillospiraceae bacterium]MBQ4528243.1 transposase [Clostridia bacterium]